MKIAAGGKLKCKEKKGVIGAVIKFKEKFHALTVYHILKVGKCGLGNFIQFNEYGGRVEQIIWDLDLAIIEIEAPESIIKLSNMGEPVIGPAYSLNGVKRINCKIRLWGKLTIIYHFPSMIYLYPVIVVLL
jgi:hypothetical protein